MKLEVGKSYRARDGGKVTIIDILEDSDEPVAAWHVVEGQRIVIKYYIGGNYYERTEGDYDILGEWVGEPLCIIGPGLFRTRGGKVAKIFHVFVSPEIEYPVKGFVSSPTAMQSWKKNGNYYLGNQSDLDLVERIQ